MIRCTFLFLAFLFIWVWPLSAQNNTRTLSGIVTSYEESAPLEGVTVAIKGTDRVSGSQPDGIYYISVNTKDSVLVFSYGDFQTEEIKITAATEYNVKLRKARQAGQAPRNKSNFSAAGNWRGVFLLRPGVEVPFNFTISGTGNASLKAYFQNAEERFEGGRVRQTGDSLFILLDQFDNELAFGIQNNSLSGELRRQDKTGTPIAVKAESGKNYRFPETTVLPAGNISGTYNIIFNSGAGSGKEEKAVGLFKQDGNKLRATFLRVTGDSRYLEGIVNGNDFYLSSFIGSGPAYYKGSFTKDGRLAGEVIGARGSQPFTGLYNEEAALPDPYKLTFLKDGYTSLDFSFPDVDGNKVSLKDEKYRNKVVILTITGTWCPNCIDEASFLAPWYNKNKTRGVEAIAIHYERKTDTAFTRKALTRFREKFGIKYDQVIAGPADKHFVATSLPALNSFLSFPTIIIIDKKGKVAKIHTGYSGPATGKYYEQFVKEFNEEIDSLLK